MVSIRPLATICLRGIDETLSYTVESDVTGSTTSLAVAKSLSLQLFEKNIGDKSLFRALVKAYDLSMSKNVTPAALEETLWKALDDGLDEFAGKGRDNLMIVIDGLDELQGDQHIKTLMTQLGLFTSKYSRLQAVTFSRNSPHKPSKGKLRQFEIKPDYTIEDLRHVAEHAFHGCAPLENKDEHAQEAVIGQLIHTAKGNFLWLLLTIYFLKKETTNDGFEKAVKASQNATPSLHQVFDRIIATFDLSRPDANHIASWMLTTERPLMLKEIKCLFQVDLQKRHYHERHSDVQKDIQMALGPLVAIQHEFVRFRHPAIRKYLQDLQSHGSKLVKAQNAQTDFVMRLMAYCKFHVTKHQEPSLEVIGWTYAKDLFAQHELLEYAVRSWTNHFCASTMYSKGSVQISGDFKELFPGSTLMAMLEWACWSPQTFSLHSYEIAVRVRESVFTEKHECVLQSMIICGTFFRRLSKITEAGNYFYRASRIGQAVLRKHHTLIATCATTFLTITETITTTTRTEFVIRKEETLRYVIDVYKHQHGHSHDLVIRYYKMLAQLYIEIHEEHKAEVIWREVREIVISKHGIGSEVSFFAVFMLVIDQTS